MLRKDRSSAWIRRNKRWTIYITNNYQCAYCGRTLFEIDVLTLDHLVPIELGGTNHASNLVVACRSCNSKKADTNLNDFLSYLSSSGVDTNNIKRRVKIQVKNGQRLEDSNDGKLSPKDAEMVEWLSLACVNFTGS
jgi:hypothetical protein